MFPQGLFFMISLGMNKWKSLSDSSAEPQSGWAEPVEMWAEGPRHCGFG